MYDNDTIFHSEQYSSIFDDEGKLISTTFHWPMGIAYITIPENVQFDAKGNIVQMAIVNKESGELRKLLVRTIEYYN